MFIKLEDIPQMSTQRLEELYRVHCNGGFYRLLKLNRLNIRFERAEGVCLWDTDGVRYLDFIGGYGALSLGHNHPRIDRAVAGHFTKPNLVQQSVNAYTAVLAGDISHLTGGALPVCSFTNCGAETVDEAIKLSYLYKKGVVLYCTKAYHGKTIGAGSALGNGEKKRLPHLKRNFVEVPFGEIEKFRRAIKRHAVSAFLVEPVQGEGGIVLPPPDYFKQVRALCDEHKITLIFDEIQTGLGRCGSMFCYEQLGVVPDILCLSKSLGGGLIPIGCIAVRQKLWDQSYGKLKNATLPTTTFGGNTLACVAAIEALTVIREEKLCERAKEMGNYALKRLERVKAGHDMITEVRGMGLLIGIEFGLLKGLRPKMAAEFIISTVLAKMLNEHHILCAFTSNDPSVLRFEPPLTVTEEQIDAFADSLDAVLREESGRFRLLFDSIAAAGKGYIALKRGEKHNEIRVNPRQ